MDTTTAHISKTLSAWIDAKEKQKVLRQELVDLAVELGLDQKEAQANGHVFIRGYLAARWISS